MLQAAVTLMSMIRSGIPQQGLCNEQIIYAPHRARHLRSTDNHPSAESYIEKEKPDVVVASMGAHFRNMARYRAEIHELFEAILAIRTALPGGFLFVWKTTHPGHVNCGDYRLPVNSTMELNSAAHGPFDWRLFAKYDKIALNHSRHYDVPLINLSYPLQLRPDSHTGVNAYSLLSRLSMGECLHLCLPGPLDLFSTMMMHLLHHHLPSI